MVGNGTVSVVAVLAVARACPSNVLPRTKLTKGRPKPTLAKPPPVTVKLAGGAARSMGSGVMLFTPTPVPETAREAPPAPVKSTVPAKSPAEVGPNCTVTVWVWPEARL